MQPCRTRVCAMTWESSDYVYASKIACCLNNTICVDLFLHWIVSSDRCYDCTHIYMQNEFLSHLNSTGPLTLSLSENPSLEPLAARLHPFLDFHWLWRAVSDMYISHRQSHDRCNIAHFFTSPLIQSVYLTTVSKVFYLLWRYQRFEVILSYINAHIVKVILPAHTTYLIDKAQCSNISIRKKNMPVRMDAYQSPVRNLYFHSFYL